MRLSPREAARAIACDLARQEAIAALDPDACIVYPGAKNNRGYGRRWHKGKLKLAHRAAWEDANGPIPPGHVIRHTCDNPPCIRVSHLIDGTQSQNLTDAVQRGRIPTIVDPEVARQLVLVDGLSDRRAAKQLGVSRQAVRGALRRAA